MALKKKKEAAPWTPSPFGRPEPWPRICPALEEKARAWAEFEGLEPVFAGE